jgi:hypothetical protein
MNSSHSLWTRLAKLIPIPSVHQQLNDNFAILIRGDCSTANNNSPPLFAYYGIDLKAQQVPCRSRHDEYCATVTKCRDSQRPLLYVVRQSCENQLRALDQIELPGLQPQRSNIVHLVPRPHHICLDYGIVDLFRSEGPEVKKATHQLRGKNIIYLGQLVQLSEEELLGYSFMDRAILQTMREALTKYGFKFGASIPWWNREFEASSQLSR